VDAGCCGLAVALAYDSLYTDPRTGAHPLRDVTAAGFADGRVICSRRLSHWIAVAATQTRATTESRDHTGDEWAEQWQTSADNGDIGFDYGPAKRDSTVVCDGVSPNLEQCKLRDWRLPDVRRLTSDIVAEASSFESRDTHDSHNDNTEEQVSRVKHRQFDGLLQATEREDQAKAKFLTCGNLEQVLDQRHRHD
jgi:hypothetical protein